MTWQILITISILFFSVSILLQRSILKAKYSDPWSYAIFFQSLVALLIWLYFSLTGVKIELTVPFYNFNIVLMGVLWGLFNIFSAKALEVTQASTYTVILSLRVLITALTAYLFLGETLSVLQMFGIFLVIAGVTVVSLKRGSLTLNKNLLYAFLTAIFIGLAITNDRAILKFLDVPTYAFFAYLYPAIFITIVRPKALTRLNLYFSYPRIFNMLLLGILWVGFTLSFNYALSIAPNASQPSTVSLAGTVVTVLLSVIFLKERDNLRNKIFGTIITFFGLLLVSR